MIHGRNESLRRVLLLMKRLAPSIPSLAGEFSVTTRTIYRDLQLLESVGVAIPRWRTHEVLADVRSRS